MSSKKVLIPIIAVVLAGVLVTLELTHITDFAKRPGNNNISLGPTPEERQREADFNATTKKEFIESRDKTGPAPEPKAIDLSAKQESNNNVTVFTKLTSYSNGSCQLTVTNGSKSHSQTAAVIYQPEFSSCAGFSVPIDAVGKGTWTIQLTATSGGTSETKTISQEVN